MAEWSARRTRNPAVPGSSPALPLAGFVLDRPEFKSTATLVNSQQLPTGCLLPAGVLNPVMLYLNYLFSKYLLIVKRFGSLREKRYITVYYHYYYYYYYYYYTSFRLSRPFLVNGTDWCKWQT